MSDNGGNRIRVILRWIQIKDNKEAAWDDEGEFRFRSKITTGGEEQELEFPEPPAFWSISDHPRRSKVDKIDKVLYEGEAGDSLVVELFGVELDNLSPNDHLDASSPAPWTPGSACTSPATRAGTTPRTSPTGGSATRSRKPDVHPRAQTRNRRPRPARAGSGPSAVPGSAMSLTPLLPLLQTVVEGPPPQDPGLVPYIPAVAFVVLAAVVWWIWRRLAD